MRFAYTRPDGGTSIVHAVAKDQIERVLGPMDDADYEKHVIERSIPPDASNVMKLSENWSPPDDRTFRNAWSIVGGQVSIDMPKARDVHRDRLRALRTPKLAALDVEYQKADEAGDMARKKDIAAKKQALRDVTNDPRIAAAKTPDELKVVIPAPLVE